MHSLWCTGAWTLENSSGYPPSIPDSSDAFWLFIENSKWRLGSTPVKYTVFRKNLEKLYGHIKYSRHKYWYTLFKISHVHSYNSNSRSPTLTTW
jgi:hypothetical protein